MPRPFLFVANNPGSLKAMLPVIGLTGERRVFLTPTVEMLMPGELGPYEPLNHETGIEGAKTLLERENPGVVITGSSVPHLPGGGLEHFFRLAARELRIPSALILDHWCNYTGRFNWKSSDGKRISTLPDLICAMDERAKREMAAEGIPESLIRVTGQPAFDSIRSEIPRMPEWRSACRSEWGIADSTRVVGFISEPVLKDHGRIRGYDEFSALDSLIGRLKGLEGETALLIKLHPREEAGKFGALPQSGGFQSRIIQAADPRRFIAACDLVFGVTSVLLLEAALLGRPAYSVQPGAGAQAAWRRFIHPVPVLSDEAQIEAATRGALLTGVTEPPFYSETEAARKVLLELERLAGR